MINDEQRKTPQVRVEGLWKVFTYGMTRPVEALRGVDLTIEKGERVAIMGPSGAGKSTLLQIIGTLDKPSRGAVYFNGDNTGELPHQKLAALRNRKVGFVFQFHHLLPEFSALENVMMPAMIGGIPNEDAQRSATEILDRMGLFDRLDHRPGELSGGEQQRVAVARAAVMGPEIIMADEPTGNLDQKTGDKVFQLLLDLSSKSHITLVVVTHSERLANKMGRVLRMEDGRLVNDEGGAHKA